jgi:hypothetical protein
MEHARDNHRINEPVREPLPLDPLELAHLACEYARATGEVPDPAKAIRFWHRCRSVIKDDIERDYLMRKADADRFPMKLSGIIKELGIKNADKESATEIFQRFYSWFHLWWNHTQNDHGLSPEYAKSYFATYPEDGERHEKFIDSWVAKLITEGASRSDFYWWLRTYPAWRSDDLSAIKAATGAKGGRPAKDESKAAKKKAARKAAKKKSPQRKK